VNGNYLAGIYSGSAAHIHKDSPPIGLDEAVSSFRDHGEETITLASVDGDDGYSNRLFASEANGKIVACTSRSMNTC
jgi:hypothetical protein